MENLFTPLKVGALELPNRVIMAPLTRSRAGVTRTPNELMKEYYIQRSSAGLIISEATSVAPMGVGYADTPGIWSDEQVAGWKDITDAVHKAGGRMFLQLWHVGRISHPMFLDGKLPVAPSAIKPSGHVSLVRPETGFETPHELSIEEIKDVVEQFRKGAENAKKAGFDGVEIHGANGYLIDQFLQDHSNKRTDEYGGSVENRARFMLEIADAVISVWGADRVGMHLAPKGDTHDMGDTDLLGTFTYVAKELGKRKIAFICAREGLSDDWFAPKLKEAFGGIYIANQGFTKDTANQAIEKNHADAIAFGQLFIANPDLPHRLQNNLVLNTPDYTTFYSPTAKGYTDYPSAA